MLEDEYVPAAASAAREFFVVLTGCSGAGKSSLLSGIAACGFRVFPEAGRQVVKEQAYIGGDALPNADWRQFLELTISRTIHHMIAAAGTTSHVFFDRSIVDQVNGFRHMGIEIPPHLKRAVEFFRCSKRVFVVPPWPEIYRTDSERVHSFEDALAMYESLLQTYEQLGYECVLVPKMPVEKRVAFVLGELKAITPRAP